MTTLVPAGESHELLPNGLRLMPGLSFEEWEKIGRQLAGLQNATSWGLADWIFYGEWEYGSRYEAAAAATGLAPQTCTDLKWLAGRFEFSRRRENLTLSHHREVAALPLDEQDRWLDLASENGWTRETFRLAIAGKLPLDLDQEVLPAAPVRKPSPVFAQPAGELEQLVVVADTLRWRSAAAASGETLEEWVRTVCDQAAEPDA